MPGMPGFEPDPYSLAARATSPRKRGASVWATVEDLAADWQAYLSDMRGQSIPVGKRGRTVPAPLSIYGFCTHAGVSRSSFYNAKNRGDEVAETLERIDNAMKDQLLQNALTRAYDSNIAGRLSGLADKTESTVNATVDAAPNHDLSVLTDEELEALGAILQKLEESIIQ